MKKRMDETKGALRIRAEKQLAALKKPSRTPDADTASVIHELQVHQVELEMQNEELRQAQTIIENSQKRFSDLYDFAPVGYLTLDSEGKITEANLRTAELLGVEKVNLVGKPFTMFVHVADKDVFYLHLRCLHKGAPQTCELKLTVKNAGSFSAQLVSTPLRDDAGCAEGFLVTIFDISARKIAEEQNARLAAIVENSYDAIFSKTLDGIVESWNLSAQRMYGYTEAEIKGQPVSLLSPPDRVSEMSEILLQIRKGETVRDFETIRRKKDGTDIEVSLMVSPILTATGEIIGASTIARDVTDRKRWERSLLDLNESLQVSNRGLEDLGHTLSHDLLKPIRGIESFSRIILEEHAEKLDTEGRQLMRIINENANGLRDMISGLFDLSRIARTELRRKKIDLSALARAIVQEIRKADPSRNAEIVIADDLIAEGDAGLLHTALENLIGNSWKFTSKRSMTAIEFGQTSSRGMTAFFLRDNGAGFDMTRADRMFALFQRLHSDAEFDGTGVGLATVQRIILRHGGEIWAEGEPGKGATFYFTLS